MSFPTWRWKPTPEGKRLFEEWKQICIGYLVSSKEGVNIRQMGTYLGDHAGEPVPLEKMGFASINHFLYQIGEYIDVRTLEGFKQFIFIKDHAVPQNLRHVRDLVNQQAKDKGAKSKTGAIRRPTRNQTTYNPIDVLLKTASSNRNFNSFNPQPRATVNTRPVAAWLGGVSRGRNQLTSRRPFPATSRPNNSYQFQQSRPINSAPMQPSVPKPLMGQTYSLAKQKLSSTGDNWSESDDDGQPTLKACNIRPVSTNARPKNTGGPVRSRYIPGLADDESSEGSDGYDYFCGSSSKPAEKPKVAEIATKTSINGGTSSSFAPISRQTSINGGTSSSLAPISKQTSTNGASSSLAPISRLAQLSAQSLTGDAEKAVTSSVSSNGASASTPGISRIAPATESSRSSTVNASTTNDSVDNSILGIWARPQDYFRISPLPLNPPSSKSPAKPQVNIRDTTTNTPTKIAAPTTTTQQVNNTATSVNKVVAPPKPSPAQTVQVVASPTALNGEVDSDLEDEEIDTHPNVGFNLLPNGDNIFTLQNGATRLIYKMKPINFPPFFRGGYQAKANRSLRAFLNSCQ